MPKIISYNFSSPFSKDHLLNKILRLSIRYKQLRMHFDYINNKWNKKIDKYLSYTDIEIQVHENMESISDKQCLFSNLYKNINISKPPLIKIVVEIKDVNNTNIYFIMHDLIASELNINEFNNNFNLFYSKKNNQTWNHKDFPLLNFTRKEFELLPNNIIDAYPLSDIQSGMIYHTLTTGDLDVYKCVSPIRFEDSNFQIDIFNTALNKMIEKHEILRTKIVKRFLCQVVLINNPIVLVLKDLSNLSEDESQKYIENEIGELQHIGYNFNLGDLYKLKLYYTGHNNYELVMINHHCILDGWSENNFFNELFFMYQQLKNEQKVIPKMLKCSYVDYVKKEIEIINNESARQFWKHYLSGYKMENTNKRTNHRLEYAFVLDNNYLLNIKEITNQLNVPIKYIFLTAYLYLLRKLFNKDELYLGLVTHGRPKEYDGDKILGCFLNTIPLKIYFPPNITCIDLLLKIRKILVDCKQYESFPLAEMYRLINNKSSSNLFNYTFSFLNFNQINQTNHSVHFLNSRIKPINMTNTLFDFIVKKKKENYIIRIQYDSSLYPVCNIDNINKLYTNILNSISNYTNINY